MLDEKIYNFLKDAGPIFYVTPTAGRAIGLEKELPDFHIICAQYSDDIRLMRSEGVKVFCLDKEAKNSGKILMDPETVDYIKSNSSGKQANIITFKPSPMIEKACSRNGFRYLGNDSQLSRNFEDKVKFAEIAKVLGVSNARSRIVKIEYGNLENLKDSLDFSDGKKYVIQLSRGYSGNSTFLVADREEYGRILEDNIGRKIKIADFVEGNTYTFDVCIGEFGTFISQPIFQITGFTEFNKNILGTCGNDYAYGKNLGDKIREKLDSNIRKVTDKLFSLGYRGVLGFDFVVGDDEVDLIEVNPRLVGSIPVFTKLQIASDETPFLLLHILSFLGFDFTGMAMSIREKEKRFSFSQLILRNNTHDKKKILDCLPAGVYKFDKTGISLKRETYWAKNLAADEFFLECASSGESIEPDMEYANIQVPYGIMETRSSFKDEFALIQEYALSKITLE